MVIVQPSTEVNNGDIVVARIFDEVTVKTYQKKNDKISLIPENPKYNPIQIDETIEFSIVGKVTGVVRWIN